MSETTLIRKDSLSKKVRSFFNAPMRLMASIYASLVAGMAGMMPTFCQQAQTNNQMNSLFSSMVNIICTIAFYVGAIIIVGGVFSWVLAQKDENADTQSRAVKFIVCGFALVALKVIIGPLLTNMGLSA